MKNIFVIIALLFACSTFGQNNQKTNYLHFSISSRFEPMYFSVNGKVSKVDSLVVHCMVDNIVFSDMISEEVDLETLFENNTKVSFFSKGVRIYSIPVIALNNYVTVQDRKSTGQTVVKLQVEKDTVELDTWLIRHLELD